VGHRPAGQVAAGLRRRISRFRGRLAQAPVVALRRSGAWGARRVGRIDDEAVVVAARPDPLGESGP